MKRPLAIAIIFVASAAISHAEARWCSITGKGPNDKVVYPAIAKAAQVQGVVLSHIIYQPNGKVEKIETISGPQLLSKYFAAQLMDWTIKTDAVGDELCQTLVIAKFRILDSRDEPAEPPTETGASIYRVSVETGPPLVLFTISDPAPLTSWQAFCLRWKARFHYIFRQHSARSTD